MSKRLNEIRDELDIIDVQLVKLLEKRMSLSYSVGKIKLEEGINTHDGRREAQVLEKVNNSVSDSTLALSIERVYKRIFEESKRIQLNLKNIYLIGMPMSGKSALAKRLAVALGKECFDVDDEVVQIAGKSIAKIFEENGEEHFRNLESRMLNEISMHESCIVATGGGIVTNKRNVEIMKKSGICVFINTDIAKLANEFKDDGMRPLISSVTDLKALYAERFDFYAAAADFTYTSCEEAYIEIIKLLS